MGGKGRGAVAASGATAGAAATCAAFFLAFFERAVAADAKATTGEASGSDAAGGW